ncbi:hypothetical protein LLH00_16080, partial [bacterium]|nr:hypothetical protein [bacterium]
YGNAKPGQYVTFSVTTGSATLKQMLVPTDGDGFASTTATPLAVGNVSLSASTTIGGATQTVTFNLSATAP